MRMSAVPKIPDHPAKQAKHISKKAPQEIHDGAIRPYATVYHTDDDS